MTNTSPNDGSNFVTGIVQNLVAAGAATGCFFVTEAVCKDVAPALTPNDILLIAAAVAAAFYIGFTVLQLAVLRPWQRWRAFREHRAAPGVMTVLIANIYNEPKGASGKGKIAGRIATALNEAFGEGVKTRLIDVTLDANNPAREADQWLRKTGADLIIWGDVPAPTVVDLVFRARETELKGGERPVGLDSKLQLSADFGEEFYPALAAIAGAAAAPAVDDAGKYLVPRLMPVVQKLKPLLAGAALKGEARGSVAHAYGIAAYAIGEQSGQSNWLEEAVEAYSEALKEWTRDRVPLQWAMTQNNLGAALQTLGARESGTGRLEEAVSAFREALKEWTRARVPIDWAMTQNNLGIALRALGERESGTARLEEAVAAYREALKEYTRDRVPLQWAMTQNNLGNALQTLGERESGTARLEEAVAAYREALKEFTRARVPLQWAATQNNLGTALQTLGARESGTGRLEEAVAAYREALKEWTRERVPLDWAMTQNNLGNALQALGARESGTGRLEEAVAAYREALKERTRERVPLQWAMTQNNLGNALQALGERESGTGRMEEAVEAYSEALKEWTRARVPLDWAMTQNNLAGALRLIGQRRQDRAVLEQALLAIDGALEEFRKGGASYYVQIAEARRAKIVQALGR